MTQALSGPAATFPRAPRSAGARQPRWGRACAEERGVAGSTPSGGSGALAGLVRRLAWLTGRPHSGGVKQLDEAYGWNCLFCPNFPSFQRFSFSSIKLKTGFTTWLEEGAAFQTLAS